VLWKNDGLNLDHKEGPGSSPILFEDFLIVNCDGMDVQYVVALKKSTGEIAWKTNRSAPLRDNPDFRKAYSTPLVIDANGRPQLISVGADQVQAYDPRTGEELWQARVRGFSTVARPLFADGVVYVCSDYGRPELWAIRTDGRGDVTQTHVLWRFARQVPASPSPLLVKGRIYMASNGGVATCLDAKTGEQLWQERLGGNFSASPIYAGGRIYFANEDGLVTVIRPGDEFQVVASNQLDGRFLASPAVIDGALLLRTDAHLYRVEESAASSVR
jgi:outer membrane protein assembly factor BamB